MASVEVSNVRKSFGHFEVLHGVSISVDDGEFVILVGPSGCGKSTLLRMVAGLESVTSGELRIDGRLVNDVPPKERDIAMVFQNYALYPQMTVAKNMSFSLELARRPKDEVAEKVGKAADILGPNTLRDHRAKRSPKKSPSPPISSASSPCSNAIRASYRAASDSGSRWDGRSCVIRRCFCSTSLYRIWTRSCVSRCAPRSNRCSNAWRRRRFTSPMTKSRR